MHELLFVDVERLKYQFNQIVSYQMKHKLSVKYCFNLIRLPYHIRDIIKIELLKTPLEYYREHFNANTDDSVHSNRVS